MDAPAAARGECSDATGLKAPRTVSLVLGSGGARGLAHIGVIAAVEARGLQVRSIVGCSMGALIGGFYAAGRLEVYTAWVTDLTRWDVLRFLDVSFSSRAGMMKGDLIMDQLRGLVGTRCIEALPIPFVAVATDIVRRREVWLARGDLFAAIRASIAIPGIFTPQRIDGRVLVDGAVLNPVPVAPASDDGTDLTIAVSLMGREVAHPLGAGPPPVPQQAQAEHRGSIERFLGGLQSLLGREEAARSDAGAGGLSLSDVVMGAFDTMQGAVARHRLAAYPPDVLVEVPANVCQAHEFHRARELIEAGRYCAELALAEQLDGR